MSTKSLNFYYWRLYTHCRVSIMAINTCVIYNGKAKVVNWVVFGTMCILCILPLNRILQTHERTLYPPHPPDSRVSPRKIKRSSFLRISKYNANVPPSFLDGFRLGLESASQKFAFAMGAPITVYAVPSNISLAIISESLSILLP